MKALAITVAVILAAALVLGGMGYVLWERYGDGIVEDVSAGSEEGKAFGRVATDKDCYYRTLSRMQGCDDFSCALKTKLFAQECLRATETITDLCDQVPSVASFLEFALWSADTCAREAPDHDACDSILQEVGKHCMRVRIKEQPEDAPEQEQSKAPA